MKDKSLKSLFINGIALAIPLVVVLYVFSKLLNVAHKTIRPLAESMGVDSIFGKFTLTIFAIVVILLFMLLLGVFMQFSFVKSLRDQVESVIIKFFPALNNFKALMADQFKGDIAESAWKSVVLRQGKKYNFAFLVEESENIGVFFVLGNSINAGSTTYLTKGEYTYFPVDAMAMRKCLKQNGVDAAKLIEKTASVS